MLVDDTDGILGRHKWYSAAVPREELNAHCGGVFVRATFGGSLAAALSASDSLVLQDSNHDTTVLSLAFGCTIRPYLPALTHSSRSKHIGKGDVALLLQELGYVVCPVFAQRLVERSATYR